jgi:iron complex outermembrane receptor protein
VEDRIRTAFYEPQLTVDNTLGEPPKFKARGGLNWTIGPVALDLTLNYVNAYQNTLFIPSQEISSWTTEDLYLGYTTGADQGRPWGDWQFGLSVQNLMDRKPPYLQIPAADFPPGRNGIPFDGTNASPVGRLIALQFKKAW